ncbi:MAG: hypothetical protein JNK05_31965 [Myxococcales bacterium]|nr:hypothetical protein [Myxococcales bacterium]
MAPRRAENGACLFNDDCQSPLVCAGRRCRVACRTDADCSPTGRVCRAVQSQRVCVQPTQQPCATNDDCPSPQRCDPSSFVCIPQCATDYDCYLLGRSQRCSLPAGVCSLSDASVTDALADADAEPADTSATDAAMLVDAIEDRATDTIDSSSADGSSADATVDAGPIVDSATTSDVVDLSDALPTLPGIDASDARAFAGGEAIATGAVGSTHACWVSVAGELWCAGDNTGAKIPPLATADAGAESGTALTPPRVTTLGPAIGVTVGSAFLGPGFTCVLRPDGGVACVGSNGAGQLGVAGAANPSVAPVAPTLPEPVVELASTELRTYARTASGRLFRWGGWMTGAFPNPPPIVTPQEITSLGPVATIGAGQRTACAVTRAGAVHCEGFTAIGANRPVGSPVSEFVQVLAAAAGNPPLSLAVRVACGRVTCCALTSGGGAQCWGESAAGSLGNGSVTGSVFAVPVEGLTDAHEIAVRAWSIETDSVFAIAGPERRLVAWGTRRPYSGTPTEPAVALRAVPVPSPSDLVALRGGSFSAFAIDRRGTVFAWGSNSAGSAGLPLVTAPGSGYQYLAPALVEFRR